MEFIIYYVSKCGLHYLAMLKLFQRIVFACLANELFNVLAISYSVALKKFFFSFFQLRLFDNIWEAFSTYCFCMFNE